MREIEFRGKRIGCSPERGGNGEWVYGYYVVESYDGRHPRIPAYEKHRIYTGEVAYQAMAPPEMARYLVDPATVGQYTGLKDKGGKKIYRDDIVVQDCYLWFDDGQPNYRGTVEWIYSQWQVVAHCVNPNKRGISDGLNQGLNDDGIEEGENTDWEVIGNIHDNPELLKKEDNHA